MGTGSRQVIHVDGVRYAQEVSSRLFIGTLHTVPPGICEGSKVAGGPSLLAGIPCAHRACILNFHKTLH